MDASEIGTANPDEFIDPARPVQLKAGPNKAGNEWVVAPIPSYNPAQGWGVKLIGQYIFREKDQAADVPPSILAAGAFYTEEQSYGYFGGYLGHLKNDQWRVATGGGYAMLHYDFYGIGTESAQQDLSIPIEQELLFGLTQGLYQVFPNVYTGLRAIYANSGIVAHANLPGFSPPPLSTNLSTNSIGPVLQWDTRDNLFYPTSGTVLNASIAFFDEAFGSDYTFSISEISYNNYQTLPGDGRVLALRAYARYAGGDAPFFALSQFGQGSDLRGYKNGKYRDKFMVTTQAEYRQRLAGRWGFVVFGGVGEVAPSATDLNIDDILWSVGTGLRFQLARENPINMRVDLAYGVDGFASYVSVTEAF
ncbi:MAG: BamA/TamA family outer membrane protein [Nibricoccus sp.]